MFLLNQPFQRGWETQKLAHLAKVRDVLMSLQNWNYYKTSDKKNLWDNPERTFSKKISAFYHAPEKYFNGKGVDDDGLKNHTRVKKRSGEARKETKKPRGRAIFLNTSVTHKRGFITESFSAKLYLKDITFSL